MKKAVVLLLLALTGRCVQAQTPAPCDTEGHRQFHFWIGDWAVFDTSGVQVGENRVDLILNDCALAENWAASAGSEGKSFNSFDPSTNTWSQTWGMEPAQHLTSKAIGKKTAWSLWDKDTIIKVPFTIE